MSERALAELPIERLEAAIASLAVEVTVRLERWLGMVAEFDRRRRDRRCRFPACEHRHDLHAHHIEHWAHGGATGKDNLILLCRFHHRLLHEDGFTIHHHADGTLTFHRPDQRHVPDAPPPSKDPARTRRHPIAA